MHGYFLWKRLSPFSCCIFVQSSAYRRFLWRISLLWISHVHERLWQTRHEHFLGFGRSHSIRHMGREEFSGGPQSTWVPVNIHDSSPHESHGWHQPLSTHVGGWAGIEPENVPHMVDAPAKPMFWYPCRCPHGDLHLKCAGIFKG